MAGILYLIPVGLGEGNLQTVLPQEVFAQTAQLRYFITENTKTAIRWLKAMSYPIPLPEVHFSELNEHTSPFDVELLLKPLLDGHNVGLMSEAGCPAIADPGADIVYLAHKHNITVMPLVGPSSILLALIGSGLNGQSFTFHGYLPFKDARVKKIKSLEENSKRNNQTQIFIETPYRSQALFLDLLKNCSSDTMICVAADITLSTQFIVTKTVAAWKNAVPELNKRPTVFLLLRR